VAYATVGNTVQAYDLLNGQLLQTLSLGGNSLTSMAREGSFLYTVDSSSHLQVIDIHGAFMVARGSLALPASSDQIFVANGIAYVGAEGRFAGGFQTADVSNPNQPRLLGAVQATNVAGRQVVVNGSGLAISVGHPGGVFGTSALDVMDVSNPANT